MTSLLALVWETADITIPESAMAIVVTVVGALTAGITYLYFSGRSREKELIAVAAIREKELTADLVTAKDESLKSKDLEIQRLMGIMEKLIPSVEETNRSVARLVTMIERSQSGKPG